MKAKRLLFLVMAIGLASGVNAQFYDSADDIYYYLEYSKNGNLISQEYQQVAIFNFDGRKACVRYDKPKDVRVNLKNNPNYYQDLFENKEYDIEYSYGNCYKCFSTSSDYYPQTGRITRKHWDTYDFSSDRNTLTYTSKVTGTNGFHTETSETKTVLKRVDKSFFKLGRSRTPSGTMYE